MATKAKKTPAVPRSQLSAAAASAAAIVNSETKGKRAVGMKAQHEAAVTEFKAPAKPRVRKTVLKVNPVEAGRTLAEARTQVHVQVPDGTVLTDADIGRLVKAFQQVQPPCAPKVNEEAKAKEAPPTALSINMSQVKTQFNELTHALSMLEHQLQPVLNQAEDCTDGEPSQVEYEGNSSVNSFLRDTAGNAENLTARIKALISRLEI